jgi:phosphate acetyltransferase/phosphate butyryltransferase
MDEITNRTFDELRPGDTASLTRTLTQRDIELFAVMSGDVNPMHVDEEFARSDLFHHVVAHGMWSGALISTVLGTELPGPGTVYLGQTLRFRHPIYLGDRILVKVTVNRKVDQERRVVLDCVATNQRDEVVMSGIAEVIAPSEKFSRPRVVLPEVELLERGRWSREMVRTASKLEPLRTAVVHPVDAVSLLGADQAAREGLIVPVLIGPEERIRDAAERASVDLSRYPVIGTEHSEEAAARAVAMARDGSVEALMKGALHTDELMGVVVAPNTGLRTARRITHVFAVDTPGYPWPLFITDAVVNVQPSLEDKRDIVQNAIDFTHALGIPMPRVALLSAVETVTPKLRSTLDAAALCKMADRGQITGGLLDGPLAFDNAVSEEAARTKGITSRVAGRANVLVVPDLESGNLLVKQLEYLADAQVAGVVLGARVPIMLTSRADGPLSRLASCGLAVLLARQGTRPRTSS